MAYSNWGAFVYMEDRRRRDREDVAVFNDDGRDEDGKPIPTPLRIFANLQRQLREANEGETASWWEHCHHAVLGDGPIRIAGYKHGPELYEVEDSGEVTAVDLKPFLTAGDPDEYEDCGYVGEYKGHRFAARQWEGNMLDLLLVEPNGNNWTARCGYLYGAGHMDIE